MTPCNLGAGGPCRGAAWIMNLPRKVTCQNNPRTAWNVHSSVWSDRWESIQGSSVIVAKAPWLGTLSTTLPFTTTNNQNEHRFRESCCFRESCWLCRILQNRNKRRAITTKKPQVVNAITTILRQVMLHFSKIGEKSAITVVKKSVVQQMVPWWVKQPSSPPGSPFILAMLVTC